MTDAQKLMFGFGLAALLVGANIVAHPPRSEAARYASRLSGVMAMALGLILAVFAIGMTREFAR